MVRAVLRWEIAYGHAKEVIAGIEALNSVCRADGEFMDAWRHCAQHAAQGSISNEVLEPVPLLG